MSSCSSLDASPGVSDAEIYESGSEDADESECEAASKKIGLKPYSFEPQCEPNLRLEQDIASDEELEPREFRIGNKDWCTCANCNVMTTWEESQCCKEYDAISSDKFQGIHCLKF